jgi:hypothetical protein
MSWPVLDHLREMDELPSYLGTLTGKEMNSVKNKIILFRVKGTRPDERMSPETSESLGQFSRITAEIENLLDLPVADELGSIRPSSNAVLSAKSTLFPFAQMGFIVPTPLDIGTDHDGAIRIVWENGPRSLELVVPFENDASAYFYYSEGDQYDLQRDLSREATRKLFTWLRGKAQAHTGT